MSKLTNIKQYTKEFVKAYYAKHGKESGLNPGVMWPRKEELKHLRMYEKTFCPSLEDLIEENEKKKAEALRVKKEFEDEVRQKLKKLPVEFKDFFAKIDTKRQEKQEWTRQREAMIEEVREVLGYRAKPEDERFQQALQERELEETKKQKKAARKRRESEQLEQMLKASKLGLVVEKEKETFRKGKS